MTDVRAWPFPKKRDNLPQETVSTGSFLKEDVTMFLATQGDIILIDEISIRNQVIEQRVNWSVNTRDAMVRKALIALGWTPPPEKITELNG